MIRDLAILLACQLAGEVAARGLGLPVPGPVLGMMLLFALLVAAGRLEPGRPGLAAVREGVGATADRLIAALGLLFVPAGVGVIRHADLIAAHGLALAAALAGSLVLTLLVTVGVFLAVKRVTRGGSRADA